ncbi:MAG: class I SAM-dependent methyltransferase, partial [Draconibacterium sp.]|nr:class I SAM-dependent methyltransferase [Draconibacterium sp.]
TIEINDELKTFATKYFEKSGMQNCIEQLIGPATEIIPTLKQTFDLVFIDADKREYTEYFELVFDNVASGGYIIADNTLWNGKVLETPLADDSHTKGIINFNAFIKNNKSVEKVIIPLRDGMTVIRKK